MDKQLNFAPYWARDYLFMIGIKLIRVSKGGPGICLRAHKDSEFFNMVMNLQCELAKLEPIKKFEKHSVSA